MLVEYIYVVGGNLIFSKGTSRNFYFLARLLEKGRLQTRHRQQATQSKLPFCDRWDVLSIPLNMPKLDASQEKIQASLSFGKNTQECCNVHWASYWTLLIMEMTFNFWVVFIMKIMVEPSAPSSSLHPPAQPLIYNFVGTLGLAQLELFKNLSQQKTVGQPT